MRWEREKIMVWVDRGFMRRLAVVAEAREMEERIAENVAKLLEAK